MCALRNTLCDGRSERGEERQAPQALLHLSPHRLPARTGAAAALGTTAAALPPTPQIPPPLSQVPHILLPR